MSLNVLVVDDSDVVRAVIRKTFRLAKIPFDKLFEAANGKEALDILGGNRVDLIFADINMPVMSGIEMIEKMSEDGLLKTIPVVVVSTEGSATRMGQLKQKGVCAYIRKPFTPEAIRNVVGDVTGVPNVEQ